MLGRHEETRRDKNKWQRGLETRLRLEPQLEKYVFFFFFFFSFLFYSTNYSLQIDFERPPPPIVRQHHNVPRWRRRTATSMHPNHHQIEGDKDSEEDDGDNKGDRWWRGGQGPEMQLRLEPWYVFFMFFFLFYWWLYVDYTYINDNDNQHPRDVVRHLLGI